MKRKAGWFAGAAALCGLSLAIVLAAAPQVEAQKGGGSSSSSRPSSGSSSGSSGGRSYGSGSSSSSGSSQGKSYGSGGSSSSTPGKSYGSGSTPPAASPPAASTPGKSYGAGTPPPATGPPSNVGTKPKGVFDIPGGTAAQKMESKKAYERSKEPATEYRDPKGNIAKIDPKDKKIAELRNDLSEERWRNRELRQENFYRSYYSRPVVVYHDPYSSFFWYWLLDRSIEQQALWAYHHKADMDAARYADLMGKNAELAARVRALEAQGTPRNPTFVPAGMDGRDLMYDDNYVNAVYNPVERPRPAPPPHSGGGGLPISGWACLGWLVGILLVVLIVYLIFGKKWGGD